MRNRGEERLSWYYIYNLQSIFFELQSNELSTTHGPCAVCSLTLFHTLYHFEHSIFASRYESPLLLLLPLPRSWNRTQSIQTERGDDVHDAAADDDDDADN